MSTKKKTVSYQNQDMSSILQGENSELITKISLLNKNLSVFFSLF